MKIKGGLAQRLKVQLDDALGKILDEPTARSMAFVALHATVMLDLAAEEALGLLTGGGNDSVSMPSRSVAAARVASRVRPACTPPMGAPKRKHPESAHRAPRPTSPEREAAEDRADAEALERAVAEWEVAGRPAGVPLDDIKQRYGIK